MRFHPVQRFASHRRDLVSRQRCQVNIIRMIASTLSGSDVSPSFLFFPERCVLMYEVRSTSEKRIRSPSPVLIIEKSSGHNDDIARSFAEPHGLSLIHI